MRATYYLLISFLLLARAILFFVQHHQIGHRRNDQTLAGIFVLFALSYAIYAIRPLEYGPDHFVYWLEIGLDGAIGIITAIETLKAYSQAVKGKK